MSPALKLALTIACDNLRRLDLANTAGVLEHEVRALAIGLDTAEERLRAVVPYAESRAEDLLDAACEGGRPLLNGAAATSEEIALGLYTETAPHDCSVLHPQQIEDGLGTCLELAQKAALAVEKAKDLLRELGGGL